MGWFDIFRGLFCKDLIEERDNDRAMIAFLEDQVNELEVQRDALYNLPDSNPDRNVLDGEYVGEMSLEELIDQYEYRGGIHLSYIELNKTDPAWKVYGTTAYHLWAINGYVKGIEIFELLR